MTFDLYEKTVIVVMVLTAITVHIAFNLNSPAFGGCAEPGTMCLHAGVGDRSGYPVLPVRLN